MVSWRGDGQEVFFRKGDLSDVLVMAVDVSTTPSSQSKTPKFLFRNPTNPGAAKNVTRDGQRFVFVTPVTTGTEPGR